MNAAHSLLPPWTGIVVVAAVLWAVFTLGRKTAAAGVRAAWERVAGRLESTLEGAPWSSSLSVKGRYRGRAAFVKQAVSHEDPIPYPHTRGSLNIQNPANLIMGLRRKSLLEEVSTRKDARPVETGDPDFDRGFFLVLTLPEYVDRLLSTDVRKTLSRYGDVEVYLRSTQIEWRRSGLVRSDRDMLVLMETIADMADVVESLPPRSLSLSERLAEEEVIREGV